MGKAICDSGRNPFGHELVLVGLLAGFLRRLVQVVSSEVAVEILTQVCFFEGGN